MKNPDNNDDGFRLDDDGHEYSEGGSRIQRHEDKNLGWQAPKEEGRNLEEIEAHLEKYIGKVNDVFHEMVSDIVHLDILLIKATKKRPFHLLVTSGMSDLPMNVPPDLEEFGRAELMMALPPTWKLSKRAFERERFFWPIKWLKMIGRLPHEYDTWVGWGHTIPNGDPAEPIANTQFIGAMLSLPGWTDPEFFQLDAPNGDIISFYSLVPLYQEEMDFKLKKGIEKLDARFEKNNISFILDVNRKNVAKKQGWFW